MEIAIKNNGLRALSDSLKRLELKLAGSTTALKASIRALDVTGGDNHYVADARAGLQARLAQDSATHDAVVAAQKEVAAFAANARAADRQVADAIAQAQQKFLSAHPWLKPQPEAPWYKKALDAIGRTCKKVCGAVADGFKAAVDFISEHFNEICVVVGVVLVTAAVVVTALSGGTLAAIGGLLLKVAAVALKSAAAGALFGGVAGAAMGAFQNGWEGAKSGLWEGAKSGFIGGLAFGFAAGAVSTAVSSVAAMQAFRAKGGVLSLRNFSWRTYSADDVLALQRPGVLADPVVLPDHRLQHITTGNHTGGGHALNITGGKSLQNAAALDPIPGQPAGVFDVTRHLAGGVDEIKTCWPADCSPAKLLNLLDDGYQQVLSGKGMTLFTQGDKTTYLVKLPDGVFARLAVKNGEIVTFFPEGVTANIDRFLQVFGR